MGGGAVHLDSSRHRVWRGAVELRLTPKAFDVLRLLTERAGQLVAKGELLSVVWPEVAVSDWVLTTSIREIRRALDDDPRAPQYLQTVHRLGYRFIGTLRDAAAPVVRPSGDAAPPAAPDLFVGRDAEIGELETWARDAFGGDRRVVFVAGEPGIGKTAIVDALLPRLGAALRIGRGQCIDQHGAGEAYLPFLDALGRLTRTAASAEVTAVLERCAPTWLAQMPAIVSPAVLESLQPRIAGATAERMLREMAEALEALAAERPLALVLEDLHWSDRGTVELLAMLARRREPARLLVIGTCRPVDLIVRQHPLKAALQELRSSRLCRELALEYLSERDVAAYIAARLADGSRAAVLSRLAALVHGRTRGNPLFVVTMTDFMLRRGAVLRDGGHWRLAPTAATIADEIPPGLKPALEKQLESAGRDDLRVLEAASLAGPTFSAATVAAALESGVEEIEERCAELARRSLCLRAVGPVEWPDQTSAEGFEFVHALHLDVLAARPGSARRQRWHRRIGERLETAYGARASEIAGELALHFERGRDADKTVDYLQQASDTALRRGAPVEAVVSLSRGLDVLGTIRPSAERDRRELALQVALGAALTGTRGYVAPEVERAYARAWELCKQAEDLSQLLPVAGLYRHAVVRGEHRKGRALAERMLRLAEHAQDRTLFMVGHAMVGNILFWLGELAQGRPHLERSIGLYDFSQHRVLAFIYGDDPQVASLSFLAWTLWLCGHPDQAVQRSREALHLAEELAHPLVHALALNLAAQLHLLRRDGRAAADTAARAMALADEHGVALLAAVARILRGRALVEQGETEPGMAELRSGLDAYRATGADSGLPQYLAMWAEALLRTGAGDEALIAVAEGLAIVRRTEERWWEAELHRLHGDAVLQRSAPHPDAGARRSAEGALRKAVDIARRQDALALELRATMSLASLRCLQGRPDEGRRVLSPLLERFSEGFETPDFQAAKTLCASLPS
jgi:predicted ATPase/DNA-binding winged helix-turn-helix (wHTH) protein